MSSPSDARGAGLSASQIAKAALRHLATHQLEPTPDNYARAWHQESGVPARPAADAVNAPATAQWAAVIERVVRGLERGGRHWTAARKKEGLQRVLDMHRADGPRLHERLVQLIRRWDDDGEDASVETVPAELEGGERRAAVASPADEPAATGPASASESAWRGLSSNLGATVQVALPPEDPRAGELADRLAALADRIEREGADDARAAEVETVCAQAQRMLVQRHQLVEGLTGLARELTAGLTELAEDQSWAQGQAQAMHARLDTEAGASVPSVRSVRATQELLQQTRRQQQRLKGERDRAREALKTLVVSLTAELAEVGGRTGRFGEQLGTYAQSIEQADSIDALASLVRQMVQHSREVQTEVASASTRLQAGQAEAAALAGRVRELEVELRRLSEEVSVDALTQVANRRGLAQAFEAERSRHEREGGCLAVGLIDIDHFKKLNDSLGHGAGDEALKTLAARVRAALRPVDHVARYGGEEFVILMPGTSLDEAKQTLNRLQRDLTASLFLHEGREVFVTFSGGVTAWRAGEPIDASIERADEALYEAKRTGRNRTCVM